MRYVIWDRSKGAPANRVAYWTKRNADKACEKLRNKQFDETGGAGRYFVKEC